MEGGVRVKLLGLRVAGYALFLVPKLRLGTHFPGSFASTLRHAAVCFFSVLVLLLLAVYEIDLLVESQEIV